MSGHLDERRLFEAADGQTSEHDRQHLAQCPRCQHALDAKRAVKQALHLAAARPLSSQRLHHLGQRVMDTLPAATPASLRWWPGLAAAALAGAACVLIIQATLQRVVPGDEPARVQAVATRPAVTASAPGARPILVQHTELEPTASEGSSKPDLTTRQREVPRQPGPRLSVARPALLEEPAQIGPPLLETLHGERSAADDLEHHLAQLESEGAAGVSMLLGELPTLLRVAARQLEPERLEAVALRIAALHLAPPEDEVASFMACETTLLARRYPAAMDLCGDYLRRHPAGPHVREVAFLAGSVARVQLGDCARAVTFYDQALTFSGVLQSFNDEAYLGRARCLLERGDRSGARADLDLYLFKHPEQHHDAEIRALVTQLGLER
ncbi:MAG: hypothetical protein ABIJ09_22340 [Pseudomonadota bacterium]